MEGERESTAVPLPLSFLALSCRGSQEGEGRQTVLQLYTVTQLVVHMGLVAAFLEVAYQSVLLAWAG